MTLLCDMIDADDKCTPLIPHTNRPTESAAVSKQEACLVALQASLTNTVAALQRDLPGSLAAASVILVINITGAAIVFPGTDFAEGLVLALLSSALGTISGLACVRPGAPKYLFVTDTFMAALVSVCAARTRAIAVDTFGTLVISMAIASFVNTMCFVTLGHARVGKLVELMPSPVLSGYMLSIGYTMLSSAAVMLTHFSLAELPALVQSESFPKFVVALVIGLAVYTLQQRTVGLASSLVIPIFLMVCVLTFGAARLVCPVDVLAGSFFAVPGDASLWSFLERIPQQTIHWPLVFTNCLQISFTSFVPNLIGRLLSLSSLESKLELQLDYNSELIWTGCMGVFTVPGAMSPTPSLSAMVISHVMGARGRLPQLVTAASSLYLLFVSMSLIEALPKMMFASLLVALAANFLVRELIDAVASLERRELALVFLHLGITIYFGMLYAVALGLIFSTFIFALDYVSHAGVVQSATSELERSTVARAREDWDFISANGASTLIIHLHGMAFFGTASQVLDVLRQHRLFLLGNGLKLRHIIFDCELCSAIDSSAVSALFLARRIYKDASLIFACTNSNVHGMIQRRRVDFQYFEALDEALEHCENALLSLRPTVVVVKEEECSPPGIGHQVSLDFLAPPSDSLDSKSSGLCSEMASPACEIPATILAEEHILSTTQRCNDEKNLSDVVAGAAIYPPEEVQQRALRNPDGHRQLLMRFTRQVESSYGITDLAPIVKICDVIVCLPSYVLFDESDNDHNGASSHAVARGDKSLFIIDKGQVTLSSIVPAESPGGQPVRHRVAKFGPGSVLSVGSFLASAGNATSPVGVPTIAVADSVCQLLRLPAQRFAALEKSDPALACRLCYLLVQVAHARSTYDIASRIRSKRPHNHSMLQRHHKEGRTPSPTLSLAPTSISSKVSIPTAFSADSLGRYQLPPLSSTQATTTP